jgi:adenylosuccinate lyase
MIDFSTYQSPFAWRYGSAAMRTLWSEETKRRLWRRVWVALADAQVELGLVTSAQADDLRSHQQQVDIARAHAIESEIHHDLMAEVRTFAEQCPLGGGIIHLGATSADVEDNTDVLRMRDALDLLIAQTRLLLLTLAEQIEKYADLPAMAFTHIQPAEPTTVGYRLAQYAQDVLMDFEELNRVRQNLRGKGFKGAVGTGASYQELQKTESLTTGTQREKSGTKDQVHGAAPPVAIQAEGGFEVLIMARLGLAAFPVATQVYPRKQDWLVLNALAGLAQSLYKFAFDLRLLQSPPIGEWSEPFRERQVGSSAMPFKRNPVNAEKIDSLARYLAALPRVAWDNAAHTLLERTLDDSANRRLILPDAFLAADELLITTQRIVVGLRINQSAIARNFQTYGIFAATERLLMALARRGADRQEMHEVIRAHAIAAWAEVAQGRPNPLAERLCGDPIVLKYVSAAEANALLDAGDYVGEAPARARHLARTARMAIAA